MTRLDRVLNLLEQYDRLADRIIDVEDMYWSSAPSELEELRKKPNSNKNLSSTVVGGRTNDY